MKNISKFEQLDELLSAVSKTDIVENKEIKKVDSQQREIVEDPRILSQDELRKEFDKIMKKMM